MISAAIAWEGCQRRRKKLDDIVFMLTALRGDVFVVLPLLRFGGGSKKWFGQFLGLYEALRELNSVYSSPSLVLGPARP